MTKERSDERNEAEAMSEPVADGSGRDIGAAAETQAFSASAAVVDPVDELRSKVASLEDSLLRAKADYQNAQRRSATERAEAIGLANAALMQSLLPIVDDLERSIAAAQASGPAGSSMIDGIRLVYENLMKALKDQGLESIPAVRERFDPKVHEALMQQPSTEAPSGTVLAELSKGYRLRGRVLRPARVSVSTGLKGPTETSDEASSD